MADDSETEDAPVDEVVGGGIGRERLEPAEWIAVTVLISYTVLVVVQSVGGVLLGWSFQSDLRSLNEYSALFDAVAWAGWVEMVVLLALVGLVLWHTTSWSDAIDAYIEGEGDHAIIVYSDLVGAFVHLKRARWSTVWAMALVGLTAIGSGLRILGQLGSINLLPTSNLTELGVGYLLVDGSEFVATVVLAVAAIVLARRIYGRIAISRQSIDEIENDNDEEASVDEVIDSESEPIA